MTNAERLDAAAVPAAERDRFRGGLYVITEAGHAALAAAGPSCERLPWPTKPCGRRAGHAGRCKPLS